jgi:galactitol-specific phosphotransferase system IIC component
MQVISYVLAAVIGFFGIMFIVGAQGQILRVVVGVVLLVAAGALIYLTRVRPQQTTLVQKIDLSGDVALQDLKCKSCGATLSAKSIQVKAGAVFINCEHCGVAYQLEEAPKW